MHFYPRSPRGERLQVRFLPPKLAQFLSTLPARGATDFCRRLPERFRHFYPRSPRGERLVPLYDEEDGALFLSTLPARGATRRGYIRRHSSGHFYPRSPRGERLQRFCVLDHLIRISIHAPREGSDASCSSVPFTVLYFYPRSPRGERLKDLIIPGSRLVISIHAPREGSDSTFRFAGFSRLISIHAPREGSDSKIQQKCGWILRKRSKGGPGGVQNRGAVLCIRYNFSTDGRRSQAFRRCEPCGRGVCAVASHRGACAGRMPGAEALGYTSKTSSWDHCGARPMCSTLVL